MGPIKVLCLVGGISRNSINKNLYRLMRENCPSQVELETFDITRLPFFSQDIENDPPDSVSEFKEAIREAEAILFITPEYNRSLPGVLKNAIDWGSRPYGHNLWDKKPAAVMGASIGNIGTFGAQHHLRQVLAYLNVFVMGQPEFYFNSSKALDENGNIKDSKTQEFIDAFWESYLEFIQRFVSRTDLQDLQSHSLEGPPATH